MACPTSQAQAESVKHAVASAATCSSLTVVTLEQLLFHQAAFPVSNSKGTQAASKITSAARPKSRAGPPSKSRVKAKVTVFETSQNEQRCLEHCDALLLATEVFNTSLKALTQATKPTAPPRRDLASKDLTNPPKCISGTQPTARHASRFPQPLQLRSLNRLSSSPPKSPLRRSSSGTPFGPTPGLIAVAECARVALRALRYLRARGVQTNQIPALQLENGMSALIGKLMALGFDELAFKELWILKRRLDAPIDTGNQKSVQRQEIHSEKDTLAGLLRFERLKAAEPEITLMVRVQMHALKLVESRRLPSAIEAAVHNMQLSIPGSPIDLISSTMNHGIPSTVAKGVRQLEAFAQILMSCCPNISSRDDANVAHAKAAIPPRIAFEAQILALEIRLRAWNLADQKGDVLKQIYEPFAKCLAAYSRRCSDSPIAKYDRVMGAFERLTVGHTTASSAQKHPSSTDYSLTNIFKTLGNMAEGASRLEEAIKWNVRCLSFVRQSSALGAIQGACACRVALLRLLLFNKAAGAEELEVSLAEATEILKASLHGDFAELDELMLVVAVLRRAAMALIMKSSPPSKEAYEGDQQSLNRREACTELVHACLFFFTRYIGTAPPKDADSAKLARYERRKELSSNVARGAIESVIAIVKISLATGNIAWVTLDSALQDCVGLLLVLNGERPVSDEPKARSSADKQLVFVKISNVYWSYYLKRKQASAPPLDLLKSLQRSVDLIKGRSKLETSAGFLTVKLERLGALHESLGKFADALGLYAEAIRFHIATGVLLKGSVAAQERSVADVWEGEGAIGVLGKVLSSWTKLAIKDTFRSRIPFDDQSLPLDERGLLLEWQLALMSNLLDTKSTAAREGHSILALANLLLSIYRAESYPIRRLRLCLRLLRIEATHADVLDSTLMDELVHELEDQPWQLSTANDGGLARYEQHLRACVTISLAFRKGEPATSTFVEALRIWFHIVNECQTWECLGDRVENRADWILQLQSIIDYLEMQGQETSRISALHLMGKVRELQDPTDHSGFVRSVSDLALQYSRLGYSGKAGHAIAKATNYVESCGVAWDAKLRWYLAYAEYLVEIGNFEKGEAYLTKAGQLAAEDPVSLKYSASSATLRGRVRLNRLIADAAYVHSQLAFARGQPDEALALAKRCVRLNYRAWSGLERQAANAIKPMHLDSQDLDHSGLNESFSMLAVSACHAPPIMSSTHQSLRSPTFWTLVPTLYRGLALLSQLFLHQGMFLEAVYYTEQAQRVVDAVGALPWKAQILALGGEYWTRCGHLQKGDDLLAQARELSSSEKPKDRGTAILCTQLANLYQARGNWDEGTSAYKLAGKVLRELTTTHYVESLEHVSPAVSVLAEQMTKLVLGSDQPSGAAIKKRQVRNPIHGPIQSQSASLEKPGPHARSFVSQCPTLLRLRGDVLRQHALSLILQQKIEDAALLLAEADELPKTQHGNIQQHLGTAKQMLLQVLKDLSVDAVFCVLPDSTISFPAVTSTSSSKERQVSGRTPAKASKSSPPRKMTTKQGLRKTAKAKTPNLEDFRDVLCQARDIVSEVQAMAVQMSSTHTLHVMSNVLRKVLILLSAASSATAKSAVNPYVATYSTEIGRTVALQRERSSIRLDQLTTPHEEMLQWPSNAARSCSEPGELRVPLNCLTFQKDYVDIIPPKWNVISVSLSESCDEIYINKLQGGLIPFMLRLPLSRHNSRDADEDIFGFEQGKAELSEIMELANFSAQDARNMTGKEAKSQWWAEREALDGRLKDLLTNIENIWLGGFRGVFSRHLGRSHLLSRFQLSFQNILGKYLPSRQATNKRNQASHVSLDSRILELFVGLADSADVSELEEPLTDLLYFVVDILQFHGERNAYDEIDFDSIIVETSDAIRCYQEALQTQKTADASHTILILDKTLHIFPWESLPCLDGQSVSRLPSLGCLRERILLQQQEGHRDPSQKFYVNRINGAYVLNPSRDLKSTQTTFERPLQCLSNWDSIVQREPSETEFKTALESRDLLLYFGHGSGAQYIRAKTIKRLDRCAVSLLMGCSSGALTEAGEFEPYGTAINYMHAGCPALVATLWDVTDKDIDRFSYTVLDKWGLFKGTTSEALKSPVKGGGRRAAAKRKAREEEDTVAASVEPVSLVEAVAKGRSSCILRYLNGAAPVVYGIPVYLS